MQSSSVGGVQTSPISSRSGGQGMEVNSMSMAMGDVGAERLHAAQRRIEASQQRTEGALLRLASDLQEVRAKLLTRGDDTRDDSQSQSSPRDRVGSAASSRGGIGFSVRKYPSSTQQLEHLLSGRTDITARGIEATQKCDSFRSARPESQDSQIHSSPRASGALAVSTVAITLPGESTERPSTVDSVGTGFVAPLLPKNWPQAIQFRKGFPDRSHSVRSDSHLKGNRFDRITWASSEEMEAEEMTTTRALFILDPESIIRVLWDICCLGVLLYDLSLIPFALAWDLTTEAFVMNSTWGTVSFWTLDIGVNFITGYRVRGIFVNKPSLVRQRYLKTWFGPDALVTLSDWISLVFAAIVQKSGASDMLRFAKLGRLIRIMGMIRMVRFMRLIKDFLDRRTSETSRLMLQVFRILCGILWMTHLLSCCWYGVGWIPSDTGLSWIDFSIFSGHNSVAFEETSLGFQYITAFHWSASQITLGAIEINSVNTAERIYNVFCLILGLLLGSTLISSLSANMVDWQMSNNHRNEMLRTLRRFLLQSLSHNQRLATRVQHEVVDRLREERKLTDSFNDVPALQLLATNLRTELRYEVFKPHLNTHSFFIFWDHCHTASLQQVTMDGMRWLFFSPKDDVFIGGTQANFTYHVITGRAVYKQDDISSPVVERTETPVAEGAWLAEAAMWSMWTHVGTFHARDKLELIAVVADDLLRIVTSHGPPMREVVTEYGTQFLRRVQSAQPPAAPWPNDLNVPFTDFGELVLAMSHELQMLISMDALDHIASRNTWNLTSKVTMQVSGQASSTDSLREEVHKGKSVVVFDSKGEVRRIVAVVAISIRDENDQMFVQIGKYEAGEVIISCQLPGGKHERGELAMDALERLLQTKLLEIRAKVSLRQVQREVSEANSSDYGVRTRYIRSVCYMQPHKDFNPPSFVVATNYGAASTATCATTRTSGVSSRSELEHFPSVLHTKSTRNDTASLLDSMMKRPVFIMAEKSGKAHYLYAWIRPEDFERLKSQGGDTVLAVWLKNLKPAIERLNSSTASRAVNLTDDWRQDIVAVPSLNSIDETRSDDINLLGGSDHDGSSTEVLEI